VARKTTDGAWSERSQVVAVVFRSDTSARKTMTSGARLSATGERGKARCTAGCGPSETGPWALAGPRAWE